MSSIHVADSHLQIVASFPLGITLLRSPPLHLAQPVRKGWKNRGFPVFPTFSAQLGFEEAWASAPECEKNTYVGVILGGGFFSVLDDLVGISSQG